MKESGESPVSVIGAGGWGTALAKILCERERRVRLWCREREVVASIEKRRINDLFLGGVELPENLEPTNDLAEAVAGASVLVLAVPSTYLRSVLDSLAPLVDEGTLFVSATKGLEEGTLLRMSEVVAGVLGEASHIVAISGPTFAREVASGQPTALVAASREKSLATRVQRRFSRETFRIYTEDDVLGVELGGALKNVIALAVGAATGLGLGHNPKAALMTRGLAEISRLSRALGGRRRTLSGLAGLGDLVLTCTGELSRNRQVGIELGRGRALDDILSSMRMVAEGVRTAAPAAALARSRDVETPILFQVEKLLAGRASAEQVMRELMARPLRAEQD